MRRLLPALLCLAALACGGDVQAGPTSIAPAPTTTTPPATTVASTTGTVAATTTTAEPILNTASLPEGATLLLGARDEVEVFAERGEAVPYRVLEAETVLGTATVLRVVEGPGDGWARVMLPGRPNGSEGWVRSEGLNPFVVEGELMVDLSDRSLRYLVDGTEVLATTIGIGSDRNPTPTGSFFVTDRVALADPESIWGPFALGLSARSPTIMEYNGGDGIIGIHGTNRPDSIGQAETRGCIRVDNEVIIRIYEIVPVGTPVEIRL